VNLREGQRVVVYGASGALGTAAVQLAKHFGAHVTAVCNTKNLDLVRSLGADEVIDYTKEDFAKRGETYDVVLDAVQKHSYWGSRRALRPGGVYVATDLGVLWHTPVFALVSKFVGDRKLIFAIDRPTKEDLLLVKALIEDGRYRAVIDRTHPLDEIAEAARYVETGQKTGNVVLRVVSA
jgi:NADPH:quinone reductase-like Zn-dependent oxidoreductase